MIKIIIECAIVLYSTKKLFRRITLLERNPIITNYQSFKEFARDAPRYSKFICVSPVYL
jgi:hypothetical protein